MNHVLRLTALVIALSFGFSLGACGQKGPLYLPGNPSEIRPQAPEQEERDDEEDEGAEDAQPR